MHLALGGQYTEDDISMACWLKRPEEIVEKRQVQQVGALSDMESEVWGCSTSGCGVDFQTHSSRVPVY
jgi:hypothetical protein